MDKTITSYKGTDNNLKCNNYQYEVGKEFEHTGNVELCGQGFHACPNPLDVFNYYAPDGKNRFFEAEQSGKTKTGDDKVCSRKIKIKTELSIKQMFEIGFKLIFEKVKVSDKTKNTSGDYAHANTSGYKAHANTSGDEAHANTSGDDAHANTSGDYAHANTSGDEAHANTSGYKAHANTSGYKAHANTSGYKAHANTSGDEAHANTSGYKAHANTSGYKAYANTSGYKAHANTSGDYAHANTSGDYAHANTSGNEAISCALGIQSRARAIKGWIVIVDWRIKDCKWSIHNIHRAKVGQKIGRTKIKADCQYWFEDGKLRHEIIEVKGEK